jgi:hypothetical protein
VRTVTHWETGVLQSGARQWTVQPSRFMKLTRVRMGISLQSRQWRRCSSSFEQCGSAQSIDAPCSSVARRKLAGTAGELVAK